MAVLTEVVALVEGVMVEGVMAEEAAEAAVMVVVAMAGREAEACRAMSRPQRAGCGRCTSP